MKLRTLLSNLPSHNPRQLTGAALLDIALGLLVVVGEQALSQEGGGEQREGYEKRLAARIARYQEANAGRAATGLISNVPTGLQKDGTGQFTVSASGLDSDLSFRYNFDIGASGAGIRFDDGCTLRNTGVSVPPGSPSYNQNVTVYACATGRYTITANLYEYRVDEDETYLSIRMLQRSLMLTASNEKDTIVRSIAAGATGYLQKYSGKEQLLTTLREVAEGEFRIPGNAARRLSRAVRSGPADGASEVLNALTQREKEILKLFAQGLTYQEIGEIRNTSGLTVRNAVSGIQRKLGFKTRQQLVVWAVRIGLVDGGPQ